MDVHSSRRAWRCASAQQCYGLPALAPMWAMGAYDDAGMTFPRIMALQMSWPLMINEPALKSERQRRIL